MTHIDRSNERLWSRWRHGRSIGNAISPRARPTKSQLNPTIGSPNRMHLSAPFGVPGELGSKSPSRLEGIQRRVLNLAKRSNAKLRLMVRERRSIDLFAADILALSFNGEFAMGAVAGRLFSSFRPRLVLLESAGHSWTYTEIRHQIRRTQRRRSCTS